MSKNVIVTGASSGIGAATARKFASAGHKVVLLARRVDRLDQLSAELSKITEIETISLDVRDREAVMALANDAPKHLKDADIVVNNAGLALGLGPADQADLDEWETMVDTNIKGLMYFTRLMLPMLIENGGGHIVNTGSIAASWPYPGGNVYGGTKAFVQQFSRNLRTDLVGKNVRVTNIEPGMTDTEFSLVRFSGDQRRADEVYAGMQPLTGDDIADIIYWVTSLPAHININALEVMPVSQTWSPFTVHRE